MYEGPDGPTESVIRWSWGRFSNLPVIGGQISRPNYASIIRLRARDKERARVMPWPDDCPPQPTAVRSVPIA